jgi:hypothetical protein
LRPTKGGFFPCLHNLRAGSPLGEALCVAMPNFGIQIISTFKAKIYFSGFTER